MKLLISGEGPRDLGACNNAQDQCADGDFNPGPMAVWLARLWEALAGYSLLDTAEAVHYVSEHGLAQIAKKSGRRMQPLPGKKQGVETGLYFINARSLGLIAKKLADDHDVPVMAVLFRDADGTRSAPGQIWKSKWDSMVYGFASVGFRFGVPMVPKPKSEAWLLCSGQTALHSHAAFEDISGNDSALNSAKNQWDAFRGRPQYAALEVDWCGEHPTDWQNLLTMPSFKAFYDRFHEVAMSVLRPAGGAL
jgi:hypothetical protein